MIFGLILSLSKVLNYLSYFIIITVTLISFKVSFETTLRFILSAHQINRDYICEVESGVPTGEWDKRFKKGLKQFRHMNTQDELQVTIMKRQAAHNSLSSLKLMLAK